MRPLFSSAFLLSLSFSLLAGCAPDRGGAVIHQSSTTSTQNLALLSADPFGGGGTDITVMDIQGHVLDIIETDLSSPVGLSAHPSGDFIVSTNGGVFRVTNEGDVSTFNQGAMPSFVFRTHVTDGGDVTVTQEYDVTDWDEDGELIMHSVVPGDYCWMDAAPGPGDGETVALLDVYGPGIALWDTTTGEFDHIASNIGTNGEVLGSDTNGNYYVGSSWSPALHKVSVEGEVEALGELEGLGVADGIWGVKAIEPAGRDLVYLLTEGGEGSGITRLDTNTLNAEQLLTASDGLWIDMTVF